LTEWQVTVFQDAVNSIARKISGLNEIADFAFDGLKVQDGIPSAILIHAIRYCSGKQTHRGTTIAQCFAYDSSRFDAATGTPYAVCIISSTIGLALSLSFLSSRCRGFKRWYWTAACTWIAFGAISFASVLVTMAAYTSYAVLTEHLPPEVLSLEVGGKFLTLTWAAWVCSGLALVAVQEIRRGHSPP
jgi:hypothetical protein